MKSEGGHQGEKKKGNSCRGVKIDDGVEFE